jgi:hypothetical protein
MHFSSILPSIITELGSFHGKELDEEEKKRMEAIRKCARSLCHNVDEGGANWLVREIASKCGSDKEEIRVDSCWMFQAFVEESKSQHPARFEPDLVFCRVWVIKNSTSLLGLALMRPVKGVLL